MKLSLNIVNLFLASATTASSTTSSTMDTTCSKSNSNSALEQARNLAVPAATSTNNGEVEHFQFWSQHGQLLRDAWNEYEEMEQHTDSDSDNDLLSAKFIEPTLAQAVQNAWETPTLQNEAIVHSLWEEMPKSNNQLYKTQLLTPEGVRHFRQELNKVSQSGIPTRRPNGMNRYGIILDGSVDGAASLSSLTSFCKFLVEQYVQPIGRMLFSEYIGKGGDVEMYPFTIRYKLGEDVKLKEHRDASVVTMNINLNLEGEDYGGSSLYFVDDNGGEDGETMKRHNVTFSPGMAVIHCGALRHAALPIEAGERHNLVIWLFGREGEVRIAPYSKKEQLSVKERWRRETKPSFI